MPTISLRNSVLDFVEERKSYFKQWIFDKPIVVSQAKHQSFADLQHMMFKVIKHFVLNYNDYQHLMPLSAEARRVVQIFSDHPYNPGTYRTDFVFDSTGQVKIIEITCRFALNTVFEAAIFNQVANEYADEFLGSHQFDQSYESIYPYLENFIYQSSEIIILKGSDLNNSSRVFKGIFEATESKVSEVHYTELHTVAHRLEDAWVISELTLEEIESLNDDTLKILADSNLINDFRTALLIHDKRFFDLLGNKQLLKAALSDEEVEKFHHFHIPTYGYGNSPEAWNQARLNKEYWILKHRALGKSKSVYAGVVTSEKDWNDIFNSSEISEFVLQQWVPQKTFSGKLNGKNHNDYITGTFLFINDHYFGLGPFRTSSYPITNVTDDRKVSALTLANLGASFDEEVFMYIS